MNPEGKIISGEIEAMNPADMELRLLRLELDLIKGRQVRTSKRSFGKQAIKRVDMITFCFHLEQVIRDGIPLLEGLGDIRDSVEQKRFKEIISDLIVNIEGGMILSAALEGHPSVFDKVFVSLVKVGEHSNQLPEIFRHLTETLKWQDELNSHTQKLVMYPAFVGVVIVSVIFFLMIYLVPQLVRFMKNMGQTLPFHTQALIAVSNFFVDYWVFLIALPVILLIAATTYAKMSPKASYKIDDYKLRLWVIGPILRKVILARFASFFALMYASGINILESIKILEEIVSNRVITGALQKIGTQISEGMGVTDSFASVKLFPPLVLRMLKVGERTGGLDRALLNVSYFYNRDVKESIERAQSLIGPAMTVVLGIVMGWIMISVLGPIYDTISKLKI